MDDSSKLWAKLSSSINYYLRTFTEEHFFTSNEELLNAYLSDLESDDGSYEYLDKKTFKFVRLNDDEIEKIKTAFLERVIKKKKKYEEENHK